MPVLTFIMSLVLFLLYWYLPVLVLITALFLVKRSDGKTSWKNYGRFLKYYLLISLVLGVVLLMIKRSVH
jgi:hypothetical protein